MIYRRFGFSSDLISREAEYLRYDVNPEKEKFFFFSPSLELNPSSRAKIQFGAYIP